MVGAGSQRLHERVVALFAGDPMLLADPYPIWNQLREEIPVWRTGDQVVLSRHADVKELLGDNNVRYSRAATKGSTRYAAAASRFRPADRNAFNRVLDHEFGQLVRMDPPDHSRVRRTVSAPFATRSLTREMRARVETRVSEGIDELRRSNGPVDLKQFAYTLPLRVLGDLLGIPLQHLDQVHAWAFAIAENKMNAASEVKARAADVAYDGLMTYIAGVIERQVRSGSSTGLVAALLDGESAGHLSRDETMEMLALMIFAGHETTSNLLAIGMLELLRNPGEWRKLCRQPELAPQAVEELLRYVTPAHFLQYVSVEDRVLNGVEIAVGDTVVGVLAAANRDPNVFADPDTLNLERSDTRMHLSLGLGPHFCLGAGLARMEATMLFRSMAETFPDAEMVDEPVSWGGGSLRTPLTLPISPRFTSSVAR